MKKTWWFLSGAIVVVLAIATIWWWRSQVPVPAVRAARREIQSYVDELAKTRLPDRYEITMPYSARIERITLREGDAVTTGMIVARVSREDLESEVAEAKAAVERIEASGVE